MRTIIAGTRSFSDTDIVEREMQLLPFVPSVVLCGMAHGADREGFYWARKHGIAIERYPAQWDVYGKTAGIRRNIIMANKADALVAFWDLKSNGTKHMIDTALTNNLEVVVIKIKDKK